MKTINTRKRQFAGNVIVHDEEIYIDTSNGTGFREVFKAMEPHINVLVHHNWSYGIWNVEDAKQDISLAMLEAIVKYNPNRGASLSTFLYTVGRNRVNDLFRKRIRGQTEYMCYIDDSSFMAHIYDPDIKIELLQRIKSWDDKWKHIMFRIFVKGDQISDVAADEDFTPWGLTRAVRRKLKEARKV